MTSRTRSIIGALLLAGCLCGLAYAQNIHVAGGSRSVSGASGSGASGPVLVYSCANSDETAETAAATSYTCRFSMDPSDYSDFTQIRWEACVSATAATSDCKFVIDEMNDITEGAGVTERASLTDADDSMVDTSNPKRCEYITGTFLLSTLTAGQQNYGIGTQRTGSSGGCTMFGASIFAEAP